MRKLVYYKTSPKPRTKRRRTNKPNLLRPTLVLSVFCAMVFCAGYFIYKAAPPVSAKIETFRENGYSAWKFETMEITGLNAADTKFVLDLVMFQPGQNVSTQDCAELVQTISKKIVNIKDVKVKRGLLSGKLRISAAPRIAVAQLISLSAIKQGFDSTGIVYPIDPQSDLPAVGIIDSDGSVPKQVSKEIVQLVDAVNVFRRETGLSTLTVDSSAKNARITGEGVTILIGPGEGFDKKAKASARILKYAKDKYKKPFELNLEYFAFGKVYLKEL